MKPQTVLRVMTCLGLAGAAWAAQAPEATIAGRVVDGVTGRPIVGAAVTLSASGSTQKTESGTDGVFAFSRSGGFQEARLSASAAGYRAGYLDQLGPADYYAAAGRRLDVAAGTRSANVVIRLWADGVIRGRVVDEDGERVPGATIDVLERVFSGTGPRWVRTLPSARRSDDRGEYVVDRLAPGDYLVAVRPPVAASADPRSVAPTYFPASRSAATASVLTLSPGDTLFADVALDLSARHAAIAGRLVGADRSMEGVTVHLTPAGPDGQVAEFDELTTTADADGRFRFARVPVGAYRLSAWQFPEMAPLTFSVGGDLRRTVSGYFGAAMLPDGEVRLPPLPEAHTWVADQTVTADGDGVVDVVVSMQPGARVSGRVVFEGSSPRPAASDLETIPVVVRGADGGYAGSNAIASATPQSRIEVDGRFRSPGLPPGEYIVNVMAGGRSASADLLSGWRTTSILVSGRETVGGSLILGTSDVSDVVLTLSDRVTAIAGTVRAVDGSSNVNARVIVFPRDRSQWASPLLVLPATSRVGLAVADRGGSFRLDVVPGDYFVAAVTTLPASWMTPDHLATLVGQAASVTVATGEQRSVVVTAR